MPSRVVSASILAASKDAPVRNECHVLVDIPKLGLERYQPGAEALEIEGVRRVADVEVGREAWVWFWPDLAPLRRSSGIAAIGWCP